jgi:hypothetical protein
LAYFLFRVWDLAVLRETKSLTVAGKYLEAAGEGALPDDTLRALPFTELSLKLGAVGEQGSLNGLA